MFNWIKEKLVSKTFFLEFEIQMHERMKYEMRYNHLLDCALHCNSCGVSNDAICDKDIIVSLTSYGKRINDVAITIESIMQGSVLPNRIILWLEDDLIGKEIPSLLKKQQERGLDIQYCRDIRSYKKIIPTLEKYPEACIITIDDDVLYDYDLVERLVNSYNENPNCVHACRARKIVFSSDKLTSYLKWPLICNGEPESCKILQTGVGGVLYPPHSLHNDVIDEKTFQELSPYGDDIWLYVMAIRNGYKIHKVETRTQYGEDFLENASVQDMALCNQNCDEKNCRNDKQIKALFNRYDIYRLIN